ncbi:reverse transcriptase domain, reverse transcriptase zinc-binding domain protein, partial [Tanacetum coccineum]
DLFLFARVYPNLVSIIMDALEEFKQVSGLVPSIPKGTAFFCNVPNAIKATILNSMPFAEVNDWRNKFLSLAGHLQLIRSVLSSMHIYWAFVFILPTRIVHELEQLMRGFLWRQGEIKKEKAKVAWDSICMPKHEGGLGIRRIDDFNVALMATHIWRILTHKESLWVKLGSINVCPLKDILYNRDIARSGFSLDDSVSNLISDGVWRWPPDWLSRFPSMAQLHVPLLLDDMDDVILWRDRDGVWRSLMQKLKTQDRLRQWDVGPSIDLNLLRCPLCDLVPDSHDHLFFECSFSSQVWSQVRALCGMDFISHRLADVIAFIVPISKGKTVISILSRIVVAAVIGITLVILWKLVDRFIGWFMLMFFDPSLGLGVVVKIVVADHVTWLVYQKLAAKASLEDAAE